MQLNDLERSVIEKMLADPELKPEKLSIGWDAINVSDRSLSGRGFLTELERSPGLKVLPDGVSIRWSKVGARLNEDRIETRYLVYVDDGIITAVEGYTYGVDWPNQIDRIELYDLKEGQKLENPP